MKKNPQLQFQKSLNKAAKGAHSCTTETFIPMSPALGRETSSDDMANRHDNATGYRILWRWIPPERRGWRVIVVPPCDWLRQSSAAAPAESCGAAWMEEKRVSTSDTNFLGASVDGRKTEITLKLTFHFTHIPTVIHAAHAPYLL